MNFEFTIEDLHFYIELVKCNNHRPDFKHSEWIEEDLELWREGKLTYFQMFITSKNKEKESLQHYVPAILLPIDDESELQERIELFLEGPTGLEKILTHWEDGAPNTPSWAK